MKITSAFGGNAYILDTAVACAGRLQIYVINHICFLLINENCLKSSLFVYNLLPHALNISALTFSCDNSF